MTFAEIQTIDESRALNNSIQKISPASVEGATVVHAKQILKSVFKLVGRDCDVFLEDTIPTLIRYLDFALCDKQHTMCEEIISLSAAICGNQTEMQLHERSLAMNGLNQYAENPTKTEVFQATVDALVDALSVVEGKQQQLISKAMPIANQSKQ